MFQGAAQTFVAQNPRHPEYLRGYRVASQSGDVRIAPLPVQNREKLRAENILHLRRIGAAVEQRTTRYPALKRSCDFKKLGKKR